ncbi:MAG: hypothetical protein ACLQDV_29490 [Candidatus Binataceae bacterium]
MAELRDLNGTLVATWCLVIVTMIAIVYQVRETARSRSAETLMHLDDVWRSERVRKIRAAAAATLIDMRTTGKTARQLYESDQSDVDEVLDYLETVAFLCARKVLDRNLVWNMFYWPMEHYWIACAEYIKHVRLNEGSHTWENLSEQLPSLRKLNGDPLPNEATLVGFLRTEAAVSDE